MTSVQLSDTTALTLPSIQSPVAAGTSANISNVGNIDPLSLLSQLLSSLPLIEPLQSSSTPSSLVTAYIESILTQALGDLRLVAALAPSVIDDTTDGQASAELVIALKEHFHLEQTLHSITHPRSASGSRNHSDSRPQSPKSMVAPTSQSQSQTLQSQSELHQCLIDSTLSLLRLLKSHPTIANKLVPGQSSATSLIVSVSDSDSAVTDFLTLFVKLIELVKHRLSMNYSSLTDQLLSNATLSTREDSDLTLLAELNDKLVANRTLHSTQLANMDKLKQRYLNQLQSLTEHIEESQLSFDRSVKNEEEKNEFLFLEKEKELLALKNQLLEQFQQQQEETWRNESLLQRKIYLKTEEIRSVIGEYDSELTYSSQCYQQLSDVYKREQTEVANLQAYFDNRATIAEQLTRERQALKGMREKEFLQQRNRMVFVSLIEQSFEQWNRKNGKKEVKKEKKKKPYKTLWRPHRDEAITSARGGTAGGGVEGASGFVSPRLTSGGATARVIDL